MKYKIIFPGLFVFIMTVTSFLLGGCEKENNDAKACTPQTSNSPRSGNFFDFKTTSPYYNQVVAVFKFNQASTSYSGGTNCPSDQCSTTLNIQNVTTKKITFDYSITFTLNFVQWNYQGLAVIDPGATLNVGEISKSCTSLTLGQIVVQSNNISYQ